MIIMAANSPYSEANYMRIGLDDLVTFAVFSLNDKKIEATFENLVVECFRLFPKRFSLVGYPTYPDSALVNKSWLRCRTDKRLIDGSAAKGFKLTSAGLELAEKTSFLLNAKGNQTTIGKLKEEERSRASKFVQHVENSEAYKKYLADKTSPGITDFQMRDLLLGTMQTDSDVLLDNAEQLENYSKMKERQDLVKFMDFIKTEATKRYALPDQAKPYMGGMNKRRTKAVNRSAEAG